MRRPGLTVGNSFGNGREGLTEKVFLSSGMGCWPWDHLPGDESSHWVQKAGFNQKLVVRAQKVFIYCFILREFGVGAR